jgi:hypothetical protein
MSTNQPSRIEELQASIADRLKRVCYDWPRDRFDEMVQRLAFITLKYERQLLPYDTRRRD